LSEQKRWYAGGKFGEIQQEELAREGKRLGWEPSQEGIQAALLEANPLLKTGSPVGEGTT